MNFYSLPPEQPTSSYRALDSGDYELVVRQQPREALVTQPNREKTRKPVDPPPIIELKVAPGADPTRQFLQSPYLFMACTLQVDAGNESSTVGAGQEIAGQSVSSLHRLKDINNEDGGFFVFGDLSIRLAGKHRLNFSLFELRKETGDVVFRKSILSDYFEVVVQKQWHGLEESTHLSRTFSDQGVRLRLRKESRATAGQKRTYPFSSPVITARAGPSGGSTEQGGPSVYAAQPMSAPHYGSFGETAPKRNRSDDFGQPQIYAPVERASISGYDGRSGAQPMHPAYPMQTTGPRQSEQAPYSLQTPVANPGWQQQYYTQGSSSAPARVTESDARTAQGLTPTSATFANEPYLSMQQQQSAQTSPTTPFHSARDPIYGHQTSASMTAPSSYIESTELPAMTRQHTHHTQQSVTSPTSSTRSAMNPPTPVYPIHPQQQHPPQGYNLLPEPSAYAAYPHPPQHYRPQSSYQAPQPSLLQQPLTLPPQSNLAIRPHQPGDPYNQQQAQAAQQYTELSQAYQQAPDDGPYTTSTQGHDKRWN